MTKLHPITKLLLVFILSIIAFLIDNVYDLIILLVFVMILILLTKIPLFSKKFMKIILGFILANISIFIAWCFLDPKREGNIVLLDITITIIPDIWLWPIYITEVKFFKAAFVSLRAIIMFFLMLFFFIGTSDRDLIYGLRSVKIPFAVCLLINLTFRGIAMFQQEYFTVREAMMTRGVEFEKVSIFKRIKNFVSIFIVLIVLMFKKTEEMSASIEARGIPMRSRDRTIYQYFPVKKKDIIIIFCLFLLLGFSFYLRIINQSFLFLFLGLF